MTLLWCLLTFVLGVWSGHRLGLGRERRAAWEAACGPVRRRLLATLDDPLVVFEPDASEREALVARLRAKDWQRFDDACERMKTHRPVASSVRDGAVRYAVAWRKPADAEAWRRAVNDALGVVRMR